MSINFKYAPISGAISGESFKNQTERAFNELGAMIDANGGSSTEALRIAGEALQTSTAATSLAETAQSTADNALTVANGAQEAATNAQSTATNAQSTANSAYDNASVALSDSSDALQIAEEVQAGLIETSAIATTAEQQAQNAQSAALVAVDAAKGLFKNTAEVLNLDVVYNAESYYITNPAVLLPIAPPVFFQNRPTQNANAALQQVWDATNVASFKRTGVISTSFSAGVANFAFLATPSAAEAAEAIAGVFSVNASSSALSASFTAGGGEQGSFEQESQRINTVTGTINFTLPDFTDGTLSINGTTAINVKNSLLSFSADSFELDNASFNIIFADYAEGVMTLQVELVWKEYTQSASWREWQNTSSTALGRLTQAGEYFLASSPKLERNCIWGTGALIDLNEFPDLLARYQAGYLLTKTEAENTGNIYPAAWTIKDGAENQLYAPNFGGQFARSWTPAQVFDQGRPEGSGQGNATYRVWARAAHHGYPIGGVSGMITKEVLGNYIPTTVYDETRPSYSQWWLDTQDYLPTANEIRPVNYTEFRQIYLGRHISEIEAV